MPYYTNHVSKLASAILKRPVRTKRLDCGRSVGLYFCSKSLAGRFAALGPGCGGKTETILIPNAVIWYKPALIACLRGIFDTDGCFTFKKSGKYPVITFGMKNRNLLVQMGRALTGFGIRHCLCFDVPYYDRRFGKIHTKHYLSINGKQNTARWFGLIGTSNPKIFKKYQGYKSLL